MIVPGRALVRLTYGSHLFGTATPASDVDRKGVYVPAARDILLGRAKGSVSAKRDKDAGEKNHAGEVEEEFYSLARFLDLAAEGQTVAVDMLFAPPSAWLDPPAPEWSEVLANRHRLVTRRSKAFVGYCRQQASKYGTKGARAAAARAALALLEAGAAERGGRAKVAELDEAVRRFAAGCEHAAVVELDQPGGRRVPHLDVCGRKLPYTVSIKDAAAVMRRLLDEYGRRALEAETQRGVDWKAMSHAVRIAGQGLELLGSGRVTFPAANVARVRAIKAGAVPYAEVVAELEELLARVDGAARASALPDEVDRAWIDGFVLRVYGAQVRAG